MVGSRPHVSRCGREGEGGTGRKRRDEAEEEEDEGKEGKMGYRREEIPRWGSKRRQEVVEGRKEMPKQERMERM